MKTKTVEITRTTDWGGGTQLEAGQVITMGETDANVLIGLKRAKPVGESPIQGNTRERDLKKRLKTR
jgi:hypothetical protein